jgi:hypothetical protein
MPVNIGSIRNQGAPTLWRLDERRFGEPIGPAAQATAPPVRSSGQSDDKSTGASLQSGGCLIGQPKC